MQITLLTKKTASGIERARVERGYGDWFSKLYEIVSTRPSFNPANNVEPSFLEDESNHMGETNDSLQEPASQTQASQFVPRRRYEKSSKKGNKDFQQRLLEKIDKITENDQTESILNFIKDENERTRQHEVLLMDKLLNLCSPQHNMPQFVMSPQSQRMAENNFQPSNYTRQQNPSYAPHEKRVSSSISSPPASERYLNLSFSNQEEQEPPHFQNLSFINNVQRKSPYASTISSPPQQRTSSTNASFRNYQHQLHPPNLSFFQYFFIRNTLFRFRLGSFLDFCLFQFLIPLIPVWLK